MKARYAICVGLLALLGVLGISMVTSEVALDPAVSPSSKSVETDDAIAIERRAAYQQRAASVPESADAQPEPASTPTLTPSGVLEQAASYGEAVREIQARFPLDSAAAVEALAMVFRICSADPDPQDGARYRDAARLWAVEALIARCSDVDLVQLKPYASVRPRDLTIPPSVIAQKSGPDSAVLAARDALVRAEDWSSLYDAGHYLIESGRVTSVTIPGLPAEIGDQDLLGAWAIASRLLACRAAGGCTAAHPQTLDLCARIGCRPNVSMYEAYRDGIPPREFLAVEALLAWARSVEYRPGP